MRTATETGREWLHRHLPMVAAKADVRKDITHPEVHAEYRSRVDRLTADPRVRRLMNRPRENL